MPIRHDGMLASGLDLATRPSLTQYNRATLIVAHDVERVLADIDTNQALPGPSGYPRRNIDGESPHLWKGHTVYRT
jgi:hypothetical protein